MLKGIPGGSGVMPVKPLIHVCGTADVVSRPALTDDVLPELARAGFRVQAIACSVADAPSASLISTRGSPSGAVTWKRKTPARRGLFISYSLTSWPHELVQSAAQRSRVRWTGSNNERDESCQRHARCTPQRVAYFTIDRCTSEPHSIRQPHSAVSTSTSLSLGRSTISRSQSIPTIARLRTHRSFSCGRGTARSRAAFWVS